MTCVPTYGRLLAVLAWGGGGLMFALLWIEYRLRVLHPASVLFIVLAVVAVLSPLLAAVLYIGRRFRRKPGAGRWVLASFVPLGLCAAWGGYAYVCNDRRDYPNNLPIELIKVAAASVVEGRLVYLYPRRIETPRLIMFYREGIPDPQADAGAMDRHVADMEQLTGLRLRTKIFYVRGALYDDAHVSFLGLAFGSRDGTARGRYVDLHELAHATIGQHENLDSDPPTFLSEGWAESQSVSSQELARRALSARRTVAEWSARWTTMSPDDRQQFEASLVDPDGLERLIQLAKSHGGNVPFWLEELSSAFWYHHDRGVVYPIGGAFSTYVIKRFGAGKFLQLYFAARPKTFDQDCAQILGEHIATIERAFWHEQDVLAGSSTSGVQANP